MVLCSENGFSSEFHIKNLFFLLVTSINVHRRFVLIWIIQLNFFVALIFSIIHRTSGQTDHSRCVHRYSYVFTISSMIFWPRNSRLACSGCLLTTFSQQRFVISMFSFCRVSLTFRAWNSSNLWDDIEPLSNVAGLVDRC